MFKFKKTILTAVILGILLNLERFQYFIGMSFGDIEYISLLLTISLLTVSAAMLIFTGAKIKISRTKYIFGFWVRLLGAFYTLTGLVFIVFGIYMLKIEPNLLSRWLTVGLTFVYIGLPILLFLFLITIMAMIFSKKVEISGAENNLIA